MTPWGLLHVAEKLAREAPAAAIHPIAALDAAARHEGEEFSRTHREARRHLESALVWQGSKPVFLVAAKRAKVAAEIRWRERFLEDCTAQIAASPDAVFHWPGVAVVLVEHPFQGRRSRDFSDQDRRSRRRVELATGPARFEVFELAWVGRRGMSIREWTAPPILFVAHKQDRRLEVEEALVRMFGAWEDDRRPAADRARRGDAP